MNPRQDLQLRRLEIANHNGLDGAAVATSLREHLDLWDAMVFGGFGCDALMELHDMDHSGGFSGDTVCVRTDQTRAEALLELTRNWHPDDVEAIGVNEMQEMKDFRLPSGAQPDKYRALQWAFNKSTDVIIWAWWD